MTSEFYINSDNESVYESADSDMKNDGSKCNETKQKEKNEEFAKYMFL